jgi:hypothetical protein
LRRRARFGTRPASARRVWLAALIVVCIIFAYELYCVIVPYRSANPLWHEVTIGQNVIGDWKYGGQDEEGYLRFYNRSETVVLPPSARLFDADGQFVVIEKYSPGSLTYALPYEAIPLPWLLGLLAVVSAAGGWMVYRVRRRPKRLRLGTPWQLPALPPLPRRRLRRARRFRPAFRRRPPWR